MDFTFKHGERAAERDREVLEAWVKNRIRTNTAIRMLAKNNDWQDTPNLKQFLRMAQRLGYRHDGVDYEGKW